MVQVDVQAKTCAKESHALKKISATRVISAAKANVVTLILNSRATMKTTEPQQISAKQTAVAKEKTNATTPSAVKRLHAKLMMGASKGIA
jgi:hypothetical protein